ncbi:MAG: DUF5320 domain-containing protein [Phycisphaerae bacterium]
MPYGDQTGPNQEGPMTGRRLGYCAGYDTPGCYSDAPPRGFGRGRRGGGRRRRRWRDLDNQIAPAPSAKPADRLAMIEETLQRLCDRIDQIEGAGQDD